MTQDEGDTAEQPTVVGKADADDSLWARVQQSVAEEHAAQTDRPDAASKVADAAQGLKDAAPAEQDTPAAADDDSSGGVRERVGEKADLAKEKAGAYASDAKDRAGAYASEARDRAGAAAGEAKDRAGVFAGEAKERAAAFAASARERAANTDVKELAASTTSLIDTARPFFLAAFAVVFTLLGFIEDDHGTSQIFVVGAILFVIAAAFSDELGHILPRARRDGEE